MKNFAFYKLEFPKGVHFGKGMLNDSTNTFHADMLFSALYIEALKIGKESLFYEMADKRELLFSDAFPYMGETYFLPKPMIYVEPSKKGNSSEKKFFKKLQYLPAEELDAFLSGNLTASDCSMDGFGHYDTRVLASIRGEEESMPYYVGTFYFEKGNGLYIIVSYETQEAKILMEELMESLSYTGIGGKKTSGLGKFIFRSGKTNAVLEGLLKKKTNRYMLLSGALPQDQELDAVLEKASYGLEKRSGFVSSENYADEQQKKNDLYLLKAGSCFETQFEGDKFETKK